ncbi:MAG TPA: histone deacetylase [Longimicrobiales bacterium]|nr:histone deacetylase [Longimicrobiales bacterium]
MPSRPHPPAVWSPRYEVDIGPHVFPTAKYRLVRETLLSEGRLGPGDFVEPTAASWDEIARVHSAEYMAKIRAGSFTAREVLTLELPFSAALREASLLCAGGTLLTVRTAIERGACAHLGGGFHHAFAEHGEGFCLINDVAVAAAGALAEGLVARVSIVDLDVHHGNGTAAIFAAEPRVFTLSMHQERNYPAVKPPSDLDIGLDDGTDDERYLELLDRVLDAGVDRHRPDLVLYLAGADPYREDQLGGLALSRDGLLERDRRVLARSRAAGAAVAVVLAGGYARDTRDTVAIHTATVEAALDAAGKA